MVAHEAGPGSIPRGSTRLAAARGRSRARTCRHGTTAGARPRHAVGPYDRGMLLVIDAGNSHVTIGVARDGALVAARRAATRPSATPDELEILLDGLLRLDGMGLS